MKKCILILLTAAAIAIGSPTVRTQEAAPQQTPPQKPVVYFVSTAHLDTQWNWTVQDSIRERRSSDLS
jgi:hypothetical protein